MQDAMVIATLVVAQQRKVDAMGSADSALPTERASLRALQDKLLNW
ncbi:hypothetical protein [Beijerinckia sp. L45]|nr:hypothetical protein [Beijerinckia sp. L45]